MTKACPDYHGLAGEHCTIKWSNLNAIGPARTSSTPAGSADGLDSDLVIDGPGNNTAFGHVALNLETLPARSLSPAGPGGSAGSTRARRHARGRHPVALGRDVQLHAAGPRPLAVGRPGKSGPS